MSALDREEAEADAEEASGRVPGGIVPGSAADYAQEEVSTHTCRLAVTSPEIAGVESLHYPCSGHQANA